jgi:hypothetical protein
VGRHGRADGSQQHEDLSRRARYSVDTAFGVSLQGLPPLPFSLPSHSRSVGSLGWSSAPGSVAGAEFWMSEEPSGEIEVGWSAWAAYRLKLGEPNAIEATLEVDEIDAAIAFVFSVLPLLLPIWDVEPFHGSAVLMPGGALVILGSSGSGKSTLAAALERRGYPFLADDTCAFDPDLRLWPGPAAINPRWVDALQVPVGQYNEKVIRIPGRSAADPVRPMAVVILEPEREVGVSLVEQAPTDRFRSILGNVRHGDFLAGRRRSLQLNVAAALGGLPSVVAHFDPDDDDPDGLAEALVAWIEGIDRPQVGQGFP